MTKERGAMPASVAVLVIDGQNGLFTGLQPVYDGAAVVQRIRSLTDRAHQANVPVIYLQDDVGPFGSSDELGHVAFLAEAANVGIERLRLLHIAHVAGV